MPIGDEATNVFMGLPGDDRVERLPRRRLLQARHGLQPRDGSRPRRNDRELGRTRSSPRAHRRRPTRGRLCFVRDPDGYRVELIEMAAAEPTNQPRARSSMGVPPAAPSALTSGRSLKARDAWRSTGSGAPRCPRTGDCARARAGDGLDACADDRSISAASYPRRRRRGLVDIFAHRPPALAAAAIHGRARGPVHALSRGADQPSRSTRARSTSPVAARSCARLTSRRARPRGLGARRARAGAADPDRLPRRMPRALAAPCAART